MTDEKLNEAYYQPDQLWTDGMAIRELHKITSIPKKDVKPWLAKQALWQFHIPPPKKINHPHYDVTKPNEQHQFDLLYVPHNVFEGNTYKYILTGVGVASRYKVARSLKTKKVSEVSFVLEAMYGGGVLKYPKVFQCDNGSEFKSDVTKLFEKHNVDIRRTTTKYNHTHTAFVEAFNKELAKLLFKPMDAQELQDPEKVLTIWVKNLNSIVNKMNNTKSSMIDMNPKDAIKLDTVQLDKTYPEESVLPEDGLYRYLYQPGEQHGDQKRRATDFIWSKNTYRLDRVVQEPGNRVLYYLQDGPDKAFVSKELMRIPEDTQVPPEWVSKWK